MIKVALIDNMNNNFFAFARYLRDLGIEAHLYEIPNSKLDHFKPQADTFMDISKLNWIHNFPVNVNNKSWILFDKKRIIDEFKKYDLLISCGLSSAFLKRAGFNSDIIIPYGSDLYMLPFNNINISFNIIKIIKDFIHSFEGHFQKKAFKNSRIIITDNEYILYKKALEKLNLSALNIGVPMVYNKENLDTKENYKIWSFLEKYDFIVFNHSRQYWKSNLDNLEDFDLYMGSKRNDKIIKAFARFLKITSFKNPLLVLFEYGPDVNYSKKLIKDLNIEKHIKWMPKMKRKNIMYGLKKAHISSNAFRENKTDIGGVCYESLAVGSIHLNNCIKALNNKNHKFFNAPMIHALTEQDILNIFIDYEKNPQKYKEIGKKAKEWFDANLGMGLAKKYVKLIELLVKDKTLTQNDKVVREIFEK